MAGNGQWSESLLRDLGEFRNGANFSKTDYGSGFPIVNVKQLYSGRYAVTHNLLEVERSVISKPELLFLRYGDILFARSSVKASGAGQVAMVGPCPDDAIFSGFIIRFRITANDRVIPEFLNYLLRSPQYRELLTRIGSGTTITNLSQDTLGGLLIELPPLSDQKAIAEILGELDAKIELNRRMNETLESLARALFKSWFVNFDPVRAKLDGRQPPNLPPATAALFPDSFEHQNGELIPTGWRIAPLSDLIELAYGKALKADNRVPGSIPVFGSNGQVGWHNDRLVEGPGIIVGRKGNPGIVKWSQTDFFPIDTTFYVVPTGELQSMHYLFFALDAQNLTDLGADSAVPGLSRNLAYMNEMLVPTAGVLEHFDSLITTLRDSVQHNADESETLAALRDTLLPRLLSGELRVADAKQAVAMQDAETNE